MFDTWFRGLLGRKRAQQASAPTKFRPEVEVLEDRTVPAVAIRDLTGFRANIMLPNFVGPLPPQPAPPALPTYPGNLILRGGFSDDGSALSGLGFNINFFGIHTNAVWVNTNGNISLGEPIAFTVGNRNLPQLLDPRGLPVPVIAPFFADVDTLPLPSEPVTFGVDRIGGHNVFGVDWINVMYSNIAGSTVTRLNQFQLILIDRSDTGIGNFDIEFNYNTITWDVGDTDAGYRPVNGIGPRSAVAGFSDGTGKRDNFFLLPGSGAPNQLLDGALHALTSGMRFASTVGRYHFFFRNGVPVDVMAGIGVDLSPFVRQLNPFRFARFPTDVYRGRFFLERTGGVFPAFSNEPVLDEVAIIPINSTGAQLTLVFVKLPKGVTLAHPSGFTARGFPFITLPASSLNFAGDRLRVVIDFLNPLHVSLGTYYLHFRYAVFAGPFDPAVD
jgi:hypothetical protein